jgi:hypothetical protein
MVSKVAPTLSAPLVLFTYYNPIIRRGMDKFCAQIKEAGAAGGYIVGGHRVWTPHTPHCNCHLHSHAAQTPESSKQ